MPLWIAIILINMNWILNQGGIISRECVVKFGYLPCRLLSFQLIPIVFPEFLYFRRNHEAAIRLSRIHLIVLLMIIFCLIKGLKRYDLGHNRRVPQFRCLNFLDHLLGYGLLFLVSVENY